VTGVDPKACKQRAMTHVFVWADGHVCSGRRVRIFVRKRVMKVSHDEGLDEMWRGTIT